MKLKITKDTKIKLKSYPGTIEGQVIVGDLVKPRNGGCQRPPDLQGDGREGHGAKALVSGGLGD